MGRGSGERNSIDEPIQRTQAGCGKSIVIRQLLVMRLGTCEREFLAAGFRLTPEIDHLAGHFRVELNTKYTILVSVSLPGERATSGQLNGTATT